MRRKVAAALFGLLLAAGVRAADPWKDKPWKEWDEKDVNRILSESPWARVVRLSIPWRGMEGRGQANPATGGAGAAEDRTAGAIPSAEQEQGQETTYLVRWASSRTLRRAMARGMVLRGRMTQGDAEKFVSQEPAPVYQLIVLGADLGPFARVDENALKEKAYLRPKKAKVKLAPDRVEIQRGEGGKRIIAVVFFFSKKMATGEAAIGSDEKGVEFYCQAGGLAVRSDFDLQKMADKEGVDI